MRSKLFIATVFLFVIANPPVMAQVTNPCGGDGDPDDPTTCPLDTWVWILAIVVPALAIWQWHQQQKNSKTA